MSAGESTSPQPYHHGNLRRAIIQATLELVDERGINGFTLSEAARRAGVSVGAPYRHFVDREAVIAAAAAEGFAALNESLVGYAASAAPETAGVGVFLEELGARYVAFAQDDPARFMIMFAVSMDKESYPELVAAARSVDASYFALVARTRFAGLTDVSVAGSIWPISHGVAMLAIHQRLGRYYESGRDPQNLVRSIIGAWVAGQSA